MPYDLTLIWLLAVIGFIGLIACVLWLYWIAYNRKVAEVLDSQQKRTASRLEALEARDEQRHKQPKSKRKEWR